MSGKNKTSSPGFVGRAIAEAKRQKEAAAAEKLPSEETIPKETPAKTTDNAKAQKVKEKQGAVAADKASTKRVREVANKEAAAAEKLPSGDTIQKETTAKTTNNGKAQKVKEKQGAVAADKASTKRVREVANKDKTDCDMGIEKPISTRPAKKSDPRRSPIARKTKSVTYFPHIT